MLVLSRGILASVFAVAPVLVGAFGLPAALAAPATAPAQPALPVAAKVDTTHAYLLHVPGIAGETQIDHTLTDGFKDGGFKGKIEIYDWTGDRKGIAALINHD